MTKVGVVIPVGPDSRACLYLGKVIQALVDQTFPVTRILLVDDMHGIEKNGCNHAMPGLLEKKIEVDVLDNAWRMGVPGAFNLGVGSMIRDGMDLIIMHGADDWLEPQAVEKLVQTYEANGKMDAYYSFSIRYSDTGEVQTLPCNFAAVTPGLWRMTGGFPPESAVGACDTMFISILMVHMPERLIRVEEDYALANYRRHDATDTATRPVAWQGPIFSVRDLLTAHWRMPKWGR